MNSTQAIVTLKNGKRKYGLIIDEDPGDCIRFVPSIRNLAKKLSDVIENIPLDQIYSIDPFLK
jgi:hypothetical protein